MPSMKEYLTTVDEPKLRRAYEIQHAYESGSLSLQEAQERMKAEVGQISPWEIAYVEQQFKALDEDECKKERIQDMILIFQDILTKEAPNLAKEHSIARYYQENQAWRERLDRIKEQAEKAFIKNQWLELYDELALVRLHFYRKQNQLYSMLERKAFTRPSDTMWLLDDFIYQEISEARALLDSDQDEAFLAMQNQIIEDCLDLIDKEETVLYPTALQLISEEEFAEMRLGDAEIGYAWITVEDEPATPVHALAADKISSPINSEQQDAFLQDLTRLLAKHSHIVGDAGELDVATGKLTLEQINLIFRHLPVDLSYVDEHDLVKFYSDTKHRVFPRSRGVIGRQVHNCHPRTSVHIVEELIEAFRSGKQDQAEFWINKPELFIYIKYVAVRDEEGRFRGVLEMMQDCTHIRSLSGSRTLLTWEDEQDKQDSKSDTNKQELTLQAEAQTKVQAEPQIEPQIESQLEPQIESQIDHGEAKLADKTELLNELNKDSKLADLLEAYPTLIDELPKIAPIFSMLKTPLARIMIPRATIAMMSARSGIPVEELIRKIKEVLA